MRRALCRCVIDLRQLAGALDLWLCMWEPEEQERYETAVIRSMTDANSRPTRRHALALCYVVATPRLLSAAQRLADSRIFSAPDVAALEITVSPLRALVAAGRRVRGNVLSVEQLLARYVSNREDQEADATLDWIDVRDLVAVARTTIDARLFTEIERRIARRGKYQRGRAANVLGFNVRLRATHTGDQLSDPPIFGG
ncbi:MAG: hypothetical protein JWN44_1921 [Myxococcales bacterium]|nr:hypothetical protein [Myxococcales bacterium]